MKLRKTLKPSHKKEENGKINPIMLMWLLVGGSHDADVAAGRWVQ
jgi:hypothetical protein